MGGVIVLGITERKEDGSFIVHGIPRASKVLDDFWNAALSEDKVSTRFMKDADATIETVDNKDIVVIRVPWVDRYARPVFIDGNLFGGTFRRTHTGDHLCKREAIVNAITNANWFDRRGVVCVWNDEAITIANPGDFRMPIEEARKPGSTDPRNEAMMRMFATVEIGERAGSGMDKIFSGWEWAGYGEPRYDVAFGPDRTTLTLPLVSAAESVGDRTGKAVDSTGRFRTEATETARQAILALLAGADAPLKSSEIAMGIGLGKTRTNEC